MEDIKIAWDGMKVLVITGNKLKVRYESNEREDDLEIELQKRIIRNISFEEQKITPYADHSFNENYFRSLGFVCNSGFIEAIIPLKSKTGFDKTFLRIKGRLPRSNEPGYYVHNDPGVNKWGVEMRLTFTIPSKFHIDFGISYALVKSPDPTKLRVNSNELCYRLLESGFNLGENHDAKKIKSKVPDLYKAVFEEGLILN